MKKATINTIDAITSLDGRYREKVEHLSEFVSEKALIRARFEVEVRYLEALSDEEIIRSLTTSEKKELDSLIQTFSDNDAERVKEIEETTRHDVKAVEYLLREKLSKSTLSDISEKAHLFLTSEDVNNVAQRILLLNALNGEVIPLIKSVVRDIVTKAEQYADVPMLARTHGQSAVPTTVGKELVVFADRLFKELQKLEKVQLTGKLSGAVGNYNSFKVVDSKKSYGKWSNFSKQFVSKFGLVESPVTTQINTYEDIVELLQGLQRINNIGIDFAGDMWRYISDGWYGLEKVKGEVGSSTMPQKINPIDFENGEGNLSLSNDVIIGLVSRLPISRLQRDLRDSTQIRNLGLVLGFMVVGLTSIKKGFSKTVLNRQIVEESLNSNWSILSEGAQVWLRTHEDIDDPYALFKELTRGVNLGESEWKDAVSNLKVSDSAKTVFLEMTPQNYTGYAEEITKATIERIRKGL